MTTRDSRGRFTFSESNNALRAALLARRQHTITTPRLESETGGPTMDDLLRALAATTAADGSAAAEERLYRTPDPTPAPTAPGSLNDLLRQVVAGVDAEEATE